MNGSGNGAPGSAPDEGPRAVHVSNFRAVKRTPWLVKAFELGTRGTDARLTLVGDGPDRARCQELARELGICDRVQFLGLRDALPQLLVPARAYLLTSSEESFGLSALEALACGTAVVGTRVGGVSEVVTHGVDGLLSGPDDIETFAANLRAVLFDAERAREMGRGWPARGGGALRPARRGAPLRGALRRAPGRVCRWLGSTSTTTRRPPIRPEAWAAFQDAVERLSGNASSVHASGREARALLDSARERTAAALGVGEDEVVFTSGGTESNDLALFGSLEGRPGRVVVGAWEHSSVLEPARILAAAGRELLHVPVDGAGALDLDVLERGISDGGCALLSIMAANNEVGMLAPLPEIAALLGSLPTGSRPVFHTDAVQALGRIPLELDGWGVDLASFSSHKVGGPLGSGVLVRRGGTPLAARLHGGGQEGELRSGTENVPAIVAASVAIERARGEEQEYANRTRALSTRLWEELRAALPDACLLGPDIDSPARLPNTLAVSLGDVDGRVLVTRLDLAGLEVSAGSACASGSLEPSHVVLAMGHPRERARSVLRLSLGRTTTEAEVDRAVEILCGVFSERA